MDRRSWSSETWSQLENCCKSRYIQGGDVRRCWRGRGDCLRCQSGQEDLAAEGMWWWGKRKSPASLQSLTTRLTCLLLSPFFYNQSIRVWKDEVACPKSTSVFYSSQIWNPVFGFVTKTPIVVQCVCVCVLRGRGRDLLLQNLDLMFTSSIYLLSSSLILNRLQGKKV